MKGIRKGVGIAFSLGLLILFSRSSQVTASLRAATQGADDKLAPMAHLGGAATKIGLLENNYAGLAVGVDLIILDIVDPSDPVQVGRLSFSDIIKDLYTFGNYAYVLTRGQVYMVDLTDPDRPINIGALESSGNPIYDLDGQENYLYLAEGDVSIYSLIIPSSPQLVGVYIPPEGMCYEGQSPYNSIAVVVAHPYLYVHAREPCWDGIFFRSTSNYIIDVSQPANPVKVAYSSVVKQIAVAEDYAFVVPDWAEIQVVAREDLASLDIATTISTPGYVYGLAVQGNFLYTVLDEAGLRILDITDPLAVVEVGFDNSLTGARDVVVPNRLAYVAGGSHGLVVVDVRDPAAPAWVGNYHTVGSASAVAAAGKYAYVSSDRLDIVDISDPVHPGVVGEYNRPGAPALAGDVLYLAAGEAGLAAIDIGNPAAPVELDLLDTPGEASAVAVSGSYAYIADGYGGLRVVEVAEPTALGEVGSLSPPSPDPPSQVLDVAVSDGYAYMVGDALWVADLYDPISPTIVLSYTMPSYPFTPMRHVAVYEKHIYVAWEDSDCGCAGHSCSTEAGLIVFEMGGSSGWNIIAKQDLDCPIGDLEIVGDKGYVISLPLPGPYWWYEIASPTSQIIVFDAANPPFTRSLYTYEAPGSALDLTVSNGLVAVANHERGLNLLKWMPESVFFPLIYAGQ